MTPQEHGAAVFAAIGALNDAVEAAHAAGLIVQVVLDGPADRPPMVFGGVYRHDGLQIPTTYSVRPGRLGMDGRPRKAD